MLRILMMYEIELDMIKEFYSMDGYTIKKIASDDYGINPNQKPKVLIDKMILIEMENSFK